MKVSKHVKDDGNGGFIISKPFAFFSLILTIIALLASAVFAYGGLTQQVDDNVDNIASLNNQMQECQVKVATLEACCDSLHEDVLEIKHDVKQLLQGG